MLKKYKFKILIGLIIICCVFIIIHKNNFFLNDGFNKIIDSFKITDNVNLSMLIA